MDFGDDDVQDFQMQRSKASSSSGNISDTDGRSAIVVLLIAYYSEIPSHVFVSVGPTCFPASSQVRVGA